MMARLRKSPRCISAAINANARCGRDLPDGARPTALMIVVGWSPTFPRLVYSVARTARGERGRIFALMYEAYQTQGQGVGMNLRDGRSEFLADDRPGRG